MYATISIVNLVGLLSGDVSIEKALGGHTTWGTVSMCAAWLDTITIQQARVLLDMGFDHVSIIDADNEKGYKVTVS